MAYVAVSNSPIRVRQTGGAVDPGYGQGGGQVDNALPGGGYPSGQPVPAGRSTIACRSRRRGSGRRPARGIRGCRSRRMPAPSRRRGRYGRRWPRVAGRRVLGGGRHPGGGLALCLRRPEPAAGQSSSGFRRAAGQFPARRSPVTRPIARPGRGRRRGRTTRCRRPPNRSGRHTHERRRSR